MNTLERHGPWKQHRWRRFRRRLGAYLAAQLLALWARVLAWVTPHTKRLYARLPHPIRRFCDSFWALVERKNRYFRRSLVASAVIHLLFLFAFTVAPPWRRASGWETAPLMVSLVSLPDPAPRAEVKKAPAKTQPKPKKITPPKKKTEKPAPKLKDPVKKKEEPKPETKEPSPEAPSQAADLPDPKPADTPVAKTPPREGLQVTARVDEASFTYDYYLTTVAGKISEAWRPPQVATGSEGGPMTTLRFRIDRTGRVTALAVEDPSAWKLFDRSAEEAVLVAQPFPPLPPRYSGQWLTLHLRFGLTAEQPADLR
jgi:protein TonB